MNRNPDNKTGFVSLVGAGPGDPELITKKGMEKLMSCDAVVYDRLASEELLRLVPEGAKRINVGKRVGNHPVKQEEINQILVRLGLEGKRVVRLKGGDSFVFGRGGEEILALEEAGIGYELVPGVTSAIAVPELAGIPVTHRGAARSFHVITGHTAKEGTSDTTVEDDQFVHFAKLEGTLVFLMGIENIEKITGKLLQYGKSAETKAAVISKGATKDQRTVRGTLGTISKVVKEENVEAPAIIVIGEVAGFEMKHQVEGQLSGVRIGITGTGHMVKKLTLELEAEGASCVNLSYSSIAKVEEDFEFVHALTHLTEYTWLVLTSTNGVHLFFEKMKERQVDRRALGHLKIAAIGKGTADTLMEYGYFADYIPERYTTVDLAEGLVKLVDDSDRMLIPRAKNGSPELTRIFKENHIAFDDIKIYEMVNSTTKRDIVLNEAGNLDYVTFASAEGVRGFFHDLKEEDYPWLSKARFACIGEITQKTLLEMDQRESAVAGDYTAKGLAEAIKIDWSARI